MVDTSRESVKAILEEGLHHVSTFNERVAVREIIEVLLSERDTFKSHAEAYSKAMKEAWDERDQLRARAEKAEAERDDLLARSVLAHNSHSITLAERDKARAELAAAKDEAKAFSNALSYIERTSQIEAEDDNKDYQRGYDDCAADHSKIVRAAHALVEEWK